VKVKSKQFSAFRYFRRIILSMASILAFFWLLISVVHWIFGIKVLDHTKWQGISFLLMLAIIFGMLDLIIQLIKQQKTFEKEDLSIQTEEDEHVVNNLMLDLRNAYDNENWPEVIKIGSVLSRPLWITGKYSMRIEIGKLVETAAAYSKAYDKQVITLIDDLGWTNVALKNFIEAENNIKHGLELALKNKWNLLACKATRHLSGIAIRKGDIILARKYYEDAKVFIPFITPEENKEEMQAGLDYLNAVILKNENKYDDSMNELEESLRIYNKYNDNDRIAKCMTFKSNILLEKGKLQDAKDQFRAALSFSKNISRKDQILENYLGIAKVYYKENALDESKKAYEAAAKIAEEIGDYKLLDEIKKKLK